VFMIFTASSILYEMWITFVKSKSGDNEPLLVKDLVIITGTTTLASPIVISDQEHEAQVSKSKRSSQPIEDKRVRSSVIKAGGGDGL
jgi:hypothetical protein